MAARFRTWLVRNRERFGFTAAQVAGHLGVSRAEYLEFEAGSRWPSSSVWERMVALYGWPQHHEGN
jgi:transcriptional regulator with XRE-family HTH domain